MSASISKSKSSLVEIPDHRPLSSKRKWVVRVGCFLAVVSLIAGIAIHFSTHSGYFTLCHTHSNSLVQIPYSIFLGGIGSLLSLIVAYLANRRGNRTVTVYELARIERAQGRLQTVSDQRLDELSRIAPLAEATLNRALEAQTKFKELEPALSKLLDGLAPEKRVGIEADVEAAKTLVLEAVVSAKEFQQKAKVLKELPEGDSAAATEAQTAAKNAYEKAQQAKIAVDGLVRSPTLAGRIDAEQTEIETRAQEAREKIRTTYTGHDVGDKALQAYTQIIEKPGSYSLLKKSLKESSRLLGTLEISAQMSAETCKQFVNSTIKFKQAVKDLSDARLAEAGSAALLVAYHATQEIERVFLRAQNSQTQSDREIALLDLKEAIKRAREAVHAVREGSEESEDLSRAQEYEDLVQAAESSVKDFKVLKPEKADQAQAAKPEKADQAQAAKSPAVETQRVQIEDLVEGARVARDYGIRFINLSKGRIRCMIPSGAVAFTSERECLAGLLGAGGLLDSAVRTGKEASIKAVLGVIIHVFREKFPDAGLEGSSEFYNQLSTRSDFAQYRTIFDSVISQQSASSSAQGVSGSLSSSSSSGTGALGAAATPIAPTTGTMAATSAAASPAPGPAPGADVTPPPLIPATSTTADRTAVSGSSGGV